MTEPIRHLATLPEILLITQPTFEDERGFFHEYWRLNILEQSIGRSVKFVQANHSSSRRRVLRGIHVATYEKLIYVVRGTVLAAIVDLRPESSAFGRYEMVSLGETNRASLFLPPGFGNSYYVETDRAEYLYLQSAYYDSKAEQTVRWDDPDVNIPWPDREPVISGRDRSAQTVREAFPRHFP